MSDKATAIANIQRNLSAMLRSFHEPPSVDDVKSAAAAAVRRWLPGATINHAPLARWLWDVECVDDGGNTFRVVVRLTPPPRIVIDITIPPKGEVKP